MLPYRFQVLLVQGRKKPNGLEGFLRPKKPNKQAYFYTIVSKDTVDQEYASKRQLFLTERGYKYTIIDNNT